LIEWIIISHCHGDHDAGAFQKILDTDKVEVITTQTIMGSFLRKYSAITGLPITQLSSLFKFRPVTIGSPCFINGGQFKFFYSLHSIPAIGFSAEFKGKSIFFSADTFYHPEKMLEMVKGGLITQERYEKLIDGVWKHDLILHEAGVPPIHTPMTVLAALPSEVIYF
jgi:phosphoribosyl 1,2-cyclic phosphodiesterase